MSSRAGHRSCNRLWEWAVAGMMLCVGFTALLSPDPVPASGLRYVTLAMHQATFGVILAPTAALRLAALWLNASWRHSAKARAVGAAVGAFGWFQLLLALLIAGYEGGYAPMGWAVYLGLIGGEVYTCRRAAIDDRSP